ncbi:eukaryotic translation initiation factor 4E-like [Uranotaenia lowii]|uniref:eukaryotic translation initiation factor 4E-like n=1 Tax=Uranotaenia lowii TaxID=190385 RepID=UPI0024797680|nr:eukaryotic translation initiation factor 4E-like [Uranotaenia lowii]
MGGNTKQEIVQRPESTEQNRTDQDGIVDPECLIKHPLQFQWTLWYPEPDKNKSWGDNLNEVATVGAVEDFWRLYNQFKSPSDLKTECDCSLFEQGIRPMWDDEKNFRGGRWVINVPRQQHHELDKYWLDTILCRIGEVFDNPEEICGAVGNIRQKMDKIAI